MGLCRLSRLEFRSRRLSPIFPEYEIFELSNGLHHKFSNLTIRLDSLSCDKLAQIINLLIDLLNLLTNANNL